MTDRLNDILNNVDERIERLIVRALDGEISAADQHELELILKTNAAAAAMYHAYRRIDLHASDALHADYQTAVSTPSRTGRNVVPFAEHDQHHQAGKYRSLRVGLTAALVAAAAMIVIASLPLPWPNGRWTAKNTPKREWPPAPATGQPMPMLVDYQTPVYQPQRLQRNFIQDVIGVQGDDPNVLIILERLTRQTQMEPVSGDI